jgi:hypothetical protein
MASKEDGFPDLNYLSTCTSGGVEQEPPDIHEPPPKQDLETISTILPSSLSTNTLSEVESILPLDPSSSTSGTSDALLDRTTCVSSASVSSHTNEMKPLTETPTDEVEMHQPVVGLLDDKTVTTDTENYTTPQKHDYNDKTKNDLQIDIEIQDEKDPTNFAGITPSTIVSSEHDDDSRDENPSDDVLDDADPENPAKSKRKQIGCWKQQRCKLFSSYWCWRGLMLLAVVLAILSVLVIVFQTQLLSDHKNSNHDEDDSLSTSTSSQSWNDKDDNNTTTALQPGENDHDTFPTAGQPQTTHSPTLPSFLSKSPTASPTTATPTFSPTFSRLPFVPNNITFATLGDAPYSSQQAETLQEQMTSGIYWTNPNIPFLVHVGDIRLAGNARPCLEEEYVLAADILRQSPVPVFIIPGT